MATDKIGIVIAWVEDEEVWDGRTFAADLGRRPNFETVAVAKSAMWLNRGTAKDLEKARAFAERENKARSDRSCHVFTYPVSEPDPLERAKRDALIEAKKATS